ncbi:MAG: ABC transporter substrate-binding protein [Spirochaetota bacterium]|nr:ABC transporter substrate-binding protein [Spirochaetota bacterium]
MYIIKLWYPISRAFCAILFAGTLASCGTSAPRDPHTYYGLLSGEPNYLNYVPYSSAYEAQAISPIYASLFEMDLNDTNRLIPLLATNIITHTDRRSFTVHMRHDAVWEDGVPVTARDLEFTWRMIIDPAGGAQNKISDLGEIESITLLNDFSFTARWKRANVNALLTLAGMTPIPEHIWRGKSMLDPELNRKPVGNGPWRFEAWKTGSQISYVTNARWWGERKPWFHRIVFRIIPEEGSALAALKKGNIDLMDSLRAITWLDFTEANKGERFGALRNISTSYGLIAWQQKNSPFFADARVRRAMTLCLDREAILKSIYRGIGAVQGGPYYRSSWAEDTDLAPLPYDPKQAAQLLDEAGWIPDAKTGTRTKDGKPFRFEILLSQGSENGRATAVILQSELSKLGVDMQIRSLEWSVFNKRLTAREFTAALFGWNNSVDCDVYDLWHSSMQDDGLNHIGYANPELDLLLERARATFDMPERVRIAHRIHRIIHEDQPYTFLIANENLSLYDTRVQGVQTSVRGVYSSWPGLIGWRAAVPD